MPLTLGRRSILITAAVLACLFACSAPALAVRRCRIGLAGEFPSGYNGLLARQGLPRHILLDCQLTDPGVLNRYEILLVTNLAGPVIAEAMPVLLEYARQGGTLLLDSNAVPPEEVVAGARGAFKHAPLIIVSGADNPLAALLGQGQQFQCVGGTRFLDPEGAPGVRVLARYEGKAVPPGQLLPAPPNAGTPAIWEKPFGQGRLLYSGPALGWAFSLVGERFEPLVVALLRHLTGERGDPQLVPEGLHLGNKQSASSLKVANLPPDPEERPAEPVRTPLRRPAGKAARLPVGVLPLDTDADPGHFNLSGSYLPGKRSAEVLLHYWSAGTCVRVALMPTQARIARVENGKVTGQAALALSGAGAVPFVIKERWDSIVLHAAGQRAVVSARDLWEGKFGTRGDALSEIRFQSVEPAVFSDDFMRTAAEPGAWEVAGGQWECAPVQNPDMGANPFTYSAASREAAWASAGFPFWDDYVFQAAVKPTSAGGAVGLCVYFQDSGNHLRFRAIVQESLAKVADGFTLYRQRDGKPEMLAEGGGCLVKGQWYRIAVRVSGDTITASVDGRPVLTARDTTYPGGRVALFVRDASARFDDVQVQPAHAVPFSEGGLDTSTPRFAGIIDVDTWAAPATQWEASFGVPGLFWRRGQFHGDVSLSLRLGENGRMGEWGSGRVGERAKGRVGERGSGASLASGEGQGLTLLLASDGVRPESGYALVVRPADTGAGAASGPARVSSSTRRPLAPSRKSAPGSARRTAAGAPISHSPTPPLPHSPTSTPAYRAVLLRAGAVVAQGESTAGGEPLVTLQRVGARLLGWVDRRLVVEYTDPQPITDGSRMGFLAEAFRPRLSSLRLRARNVLDYTFDQAPTDWWVSGGIWEVTNRWSCTPDWSWFGGSSPEVAAIWHKRAFAGDVVLDYYVGPRMYNRGANRPQEVCKDFNAVICGDGRSATSGYSFAVGAEENGAGVRLLRNNTVVATNDAFRFYSGAHNRWFSLRVEKQGDTVSLYIEGQKMLSYTDPHPLPGGYVGLWTRDNGVMIPRVTLYYQAMTGQTLSAF